MCPCAKDSEDPVRKIIRNGKIERMASSLVGRTETSFFVRGSAAMSNFKWRSNNRHQTLQPS